MARNVTPFTRLYRCHLNWVFLSSSIVISVTPAPPQARKGPISTGTIIAIVVILVVIVLVIVGIVLYKYCHARNQLFQFAVDGDTLRPSLRSRVKNAIGKKQTANMYYNHSQEQINFDDSKPFVDHDELWAARTIVWAWNFTVQTFLYTQWGEMTVSKKYSMLSVLVISQCNGIQK